MVETNIRVLPEELDPYHTIDTSTPIDIREIHDQRSQRLSANEESRYLSGSISNAADGPPGTFFQSFGGPFDRS